MQAYLAEMEDCLAGMTKRPVLVYLSFMATEETFYKKEMERISRDVNLPEYLYIRVRQSKHFMEKYYADKIELEKIAMAACMSRFHFVRVFQTIYGVTPRQFLKDVRINKAKVLLKDGLTIASVCYEVGYDSVPTFSSAFKRGTGLSPAKYRQSNHRNPE
jgi:AraC-like DNA-binding protein